MKKLTVCFLLLVSIAFSLSAQILTQKTEAKFINDKIKLADKANIEVVTMPSVNVVKLLAEDETERGLDLPFRFGYIFNVNYNLSNSGTWTEVERGRVWSLKIASAGAYSINLFYDNFFLPEGS